MRKSAPIKVPVAFKIEPTLWERVMRIRGKMPVPPTRTAVVEEALRRYADSEEKAARR